MGKEIASGHAGGGAGLIDACDRGLEIEVGFGGATFEIVEDRVIEQFPPRTFGEVVERCSFFPR
jgi:hypothetical protein